jgi:hypothetical protein
MPADNPPPAVSERLQRVLGAKVLNGRLAEPEPVPIVTKCQLRALANDRPTRPVGMPRTVVDRRLPLFGVESEDLVSVSVPDSW